MDLTSLREQTRAEHESVESVMPLMDAGLTRAVYTRTLAAMYPFLRAWEVFAGAQAPAALRPMIAARQRSVLLAADLAHLGAALPPVRDFPLSATPESFFGALYVMEGSTLGGQYIARHVEETLHLTAGEGNAYFVGYAGATGSMWNETKAALAALPSEQAPAVIAAARATFAAFEAALRPAVTGSLPAR